MGRQQPDATSLVLNNIWYGCQIRNNRAALVPRLCTAKPKLVNRSPLTVRFTYKPDAEWSDGKEVTAADFRATWQVFTNPDFNVVSRTGWEDIASVGGGNGKTVTVAFKKVYAAWESLVSSGPYPAHIIAGKNMNEMFLNSIPVSSGPWLFDSWTKGQSITVRKNPRFKASVAPPMKLDRVVFRYILDTNARFQSLKANEAQVMETPRAAPDRRLHDGRQVRRGPPARVRVRAHRLPVRPQGPPGPEAAVHPQGADHRHEPRQIARLSTRTSRPACGRCRA